MTASASLTGALLAGAALAGGPPSAAARLRALRPRPDPREREGATTGIPNRAATRAVPASALAGLAAAVLLAGVTGIVVGGIVAFAGPPALRRLESSADRAARQRLTAELPVAVELLVAVLEAGAPVETGLRVVSQALGGPAAQAFAAAADRLGVGTEPRVAWAPWFDDPALGRLARAAVRAHTSGAPLAAALTRVADDLRSRARLQAETSARRVGVLAVAPLGLCFLPAFVLLGVLPVVVGLAGVALAPGP